MGHYFDLFRKLITYPRRVCAAEIYKNLEGISAPEELLDLYELLEIEFVDRSYYNPFLSKRTVEPMLWAVLVHLQIAPHPLPHWVVLLHLQIAPHPSTSDAYMQKWFNTMERAIENFRDLHKEWWASIAREMQAPVHWQPGIHAQLNADFRLRVFCLLCARQRKESALAQLPLDCFERVVEELAKIEAYIE